MALTSEDLKQIKDVVTEVVEPRFDKVDQQFKDIVFGVNQQFDTVLTQIDGIYERFDAIDLRFISVDGQLADIGEDVAVVKDMVKDHNFRIMRLEHRTFGAK